MHKKCMLTNNVAVSFLLLELVSQPLESASEIFPCPCVAGNLLQPLHHHHLPRSLHALQIFIQLGPVILRIVISQVRLSRGSMMDPQLLDSNVLGLQTAISHCEQMWQDIRILLQWCQIAIVRWKRGGCHSAPWEIFWKYRQNGGHRSAKLEKIKNKIDIICKYWQELAWKLCKYSNFMISMKSQRVDPWNMTDIAHRTWAIIRVLGKNCWKVGWN